MQRYPLGYLQTKTALTHEHQADDRLVTVTVLQGELDFYLLKENMELLFLKHPLLRCTLHQEDNRYYLQEDVNFNSIPLKHIKNSHLDNWRELVSSKLKEPFPVFRYLWEYVLLSLADSKHYLIFSFHHCITDGIASVDLVHQLLELYTNPEKKQAIYPKNAVKPAEQYFKEKRSFADYSNAVNSVEAPQATLFEKNIPITQRESRNYLVAFTLEPLQIISKKFNLKINSLLTAILILSLFEQKPDKDVLISTCVNLRGRIPDVALTSEDFGLLFTGFTNYFKKAELEKLNFIEMIKWVENQIYLQMQRFIQPPDNVTPDQVDQFFGISKQVTANSFQCNLDLSNLGKINLQKNYGDKQLETLAYFFFVNQVLGFSEIVFCCNTLGNTVFTNFTYVYPLHSPEWMEAFIQTFTNKMREYVPDFNMVAEWTDALFLKQPLLTSQAYRLQI